MIGVFRGDHPRVKLVLPGRQGSIEIEFVADTGFNGDLAVPYQIAVQLESVRAGPQDYMLANGQFLQCASYEVMLDWFEESRPTEVLILEGEPLLGTVLMREHLLQVEMTDGGETLIEPL